MLGDPGPWVPGHPQRGREVAAAGVVASLAGVAAQGAGLLLQREEGCQQPNHTGPLLLGPGSLCLDQGHYVRTLSSILEVHQLPGCPWLPKEAGTMCSTDR